MSFNSTFVFLPRLTSYCASFTEQTTAKYKLFVNFLTQAQICFRGSFTGKLWASFVMFELRLREYLIGICIHVLVFLFYLDYTRNVLVKLL